MAFLSDSMVTPSMVSAAQQDNRIFGILAKIQAELVLPKNQYNSFGKYSYRNAEDMLAVIKPICHKYGTTLFFTDTIEAIGDRTYVKATLTLMTLDGKSVLQNTAYAREEESRSGMSAAQVTGACSSFARKYCLTATFAVGTDNDPDNYDNTKQGK